MINSINSNEAKWKKSINVFGRQVDLTPINPGVAGVAETVTGLGYSAVPGIAEAKLAGAATDVIADAHGAPSQIAGGLMQAGLDYALAGRAGKVLGASGGAIRTAFSKIGLDTFGAWAADEAANVTVKTGVKTAAADLTAEGVTTTVKSAGIKAAQTALTKEAAKRGMYALLQDGAISTGYQIAADLKSGKTAGQIVAGTPQSFKTGVEMGAIFRGTISAVGKLSPAAATEAARAEIGASMGKLAQDVGPANIIKSLGDSAESQYLADMMSKRSDLVHTGGPVQAAERLGAEVKMSSARPTDELGNYVNAKYSVVDGKPVIEVWDQSPNSIHHEAGHLVWDSLDKLGASESKALKSRIMQEVDQIIPKDSGVASERFATLFRSVQENPSLVANYPWMKSTIESTYGFPVNITDEAVQRTTSRVAELKTNMERAGISTETFDKLVNSGADINDIEKAYNDQVKSSSSNLIEKQRATAVDTIQQQLGISHENAHQIANNLTEEQLTQGGKVDVGFGEVKLPKMEAPTIAPVDLSAQSASPTPGFFPNEAAAPGATGAAPERQSAISQPVDRIGAATPEYKSTTTSDQALASDISAKESQPDVQQKLATQRGEVVTEDKVIRGAKKLIADGKMTKEDLLNAKPGSVTSAEGVAAARILSVQELKNASRLAEEIDLTFDPARKAELQAQYNKSQGDAIQMYVNARGLTSEAARATRASQTMVSASEFEKDAGALSKEFIDNVRKTDPELAKQLENDPAFKTNVAKKIIDGYFSYKIPAILSGPNTYLRIGGDNIGSAVVQSTAKIVTGAFYRPSDFVPMLMDLVNGTKKGFSDAVGIWSGETAGNAEVRSSVYGDNATGGRFDAGTQKISRVSEFIGKVMDTVDRATTGGYTELVRGIAERDAEAAGKSLSSPQVQAEVTRQTNLEYLKIVKQNNPEGSLGKLNQALNQMKSSDDPFVRFTGKTLFTFSRTAMNVANMEMDFLPVTSWYKAGSSFVTEGATRASYEAAGKAIIGTGLFAYMSDKILTSNNKDKSSVFITGAGPKTTEEKALWEQNGARPYSIKIGNQWVPYLFTSGPLAGVLAMAGSVSDAHYFNSEDTTPGAKLWNGMLSWASAELNRSFMYNTQKMMVSLSDPSKLGDYAARSVIGNLIPVPAIISQTASYYKSATGQRFDPKPTNLIQQAAMGAGLYDTLPDKTAQKLFGKTDYYLDAYGQKMQKDLIYGLTWTKDSKDPVTMEMLNTGNKITHSTSINGVKLKPDQQATLLSVLGNAVHDSLAVTIAGKKYQSATDDQKKLMVQDVISSLDTAAKSELTTIYPELKVDKASSNYKLKQEVSRFKRGDTRSMKQVSDQAIQDQIDQLQANQATQ
jgi:hypothetical protein